MSLSLNNANLISTLDQHGGATVSRVITPAELSPLDQLTKRLIATWETNKDQDKDFWWYRDEDASKDILYRIHHLETKDPQFEKLLDHPAIQRLRDQIFKAPSKATACALIYKSPGKSAPVPWHRDPIEVPAQTVYNFSIYLDESDNQNGAIEIVAGSHKKEKEADEKDPQHTQVLTASPGDITIHDVKVYHGSKGTSDQRMRRSIVVEFQPLSLIKTLQETK
jgi:phytanoyl-CoA hydroxylase